MIQETTRDKDSGHYNTFVESGVIVLATEKKLEVNINNVIYVYSDTFVQKLKDKNGNDVYMVPGIPRVEYNTLVNEKNSGSKRYLYDAQDVKIFNF